MHYAVLLWVPPPSSTLTICWSGAIRPPEGHTWPTVSSFQSAWGKSTVDTHNYYNECLHRYKCTIVLLLSTWSILTMLFLVWNIIKELHQLYLVLLFGWYHDHQCCICFSVYLYILQICSLISSRKEVSKPVAELTLTDTRKHRLKQLGYQLAYQHPSDSSLKNLFIIRSNLSNTAKANANTLALLQRC